ncbi:hypothetical protein [Hymenobacter guriensis]|uniref:Secreted protein n=1 Tax=Hymenobacter guriensis TaxID=2793065 RepID=A0ABS0L0B6_9BACT|nr:hypothetical protein [Hymenobacter guriensis]MBG8553557.1 hypothetical protein [Hymenobacter guriensis]
MPLLAHFWFSLRFATLAVSVIIALGLNHREVEMLHLPAIHAKAGTLAVPPEVSVVKHKVVLEATHTHGHYVAPAVLAWLPAPALAACRKPLLRRALTVPRQRPCRSPERGAPAELLARVTVVCE